MSQPRMASPADAKPQTVLVNGQARIVPDLTHHLSDLAKRRKPSPLKALARYLGQPGLIQLAGGTPHPQYFPYETLSAKVLAHDSFDAKTGAAGSSSIGGWLWNLVGLGDSKRTTEISVPKYAPTREDLQLAVTLQYDTAQGFIQLRNFIDEFVRKVYRPYLPTTASMMTTGNTDGWNRFVETFCNYGDGLLVEEWSYPSAVFTSRPHGVNSVPIAMDGEGMRADALETVLATWDEAKRGFKRPHVMYLVPIGQNPSGATMGAERKKAIYEVCVKYDVIICEDDPYYFLQEGPYVPQAQRKTQTMTSEEWIDSLSPSFLKFDYEGRVVRLDTFSKTVAPGSRLGWVTGSPVLVDRILRVGEVSTQAPCGFGQSMVTELLVNHWGFDKYVRWLQGLQQEYTDRRDMLLDAIAQEFEVFDGHSDPSFLSGTTMLCAREKRATWMPTFADEKGKDTWFSFIPPTSGMFVWVRVHLLNHPAYKRGVGPTDPNEPQAPQTLEEQLFVTIAESNLLVGPGWFFSTKQEEEVYIDASDFSGEGRRIVNGLLRGDDPSGSPDDHDPAQYAHFRLAFSMATKEQMKTAMQIMSKVLHNFFKQSY